MKRLRSVLVRRHEPPAPSALARRERRGGFALLITIVLVAFLVLLLVGLATFTRVETQVATNSQSLAQARQNALMALNIAVGQLQKYTGPDQRVTATAEVQPIADGAKADPASGTDLTAATATVFTNIDTYWRASRNRRWTGAWKNGNASAFDADNPANFNPAPALQSWLVSGNEQIGDTFKPTDTVAGFTLPLVTASDAPTREIADAAGNIYRLMVGAHTVGLDSTTSVAADLDRAVVAPQVDIKASSVPGLPGQQTVGHYAWWIGDEGVKAKATLTDSYYSASPSPAENRIRLASAQRPALEAISPALDLAYPENNSVLEKVTSYGQLNFASGAAAAPQEFQTRFHDLTVHSRGILSDSRHGGLRGDLSYLLGQSSLGDFRTALNAALPGAAPATAASDYNPILAPTSTVYATQPPSLLSSAGPFSGNNVYQTMDMLRYSATWEQLWSYFNMGNTTGSTPAGVFSGSDLVTPRRHTGTQHGIYPLLVQAKLFYRLRMANAVADADGVNRAGNIWVDIIPVVVLANPYNVDLDGADYFLAFDGGTAARLRLYYGMTPANPDSPADSEFPFPTSAAPNPPNSLQINNSGMGEIRIRITTPRMEAGRAYVFTLENASTTIPATPAAQRALAVRMVYGFTPDNVLTYDTGAHIAASPATHAALTTENAVAVLKLYSGDFTEALGDQTLLRHFAPHTYVADSANNTVLVYPISNGFRNGGGLGMFIHDASNVSESQQTTFSQLNYRGLTVNNAAYTSYSSKDIAISWARTRTKNGASSFANDSTPNDNIQSHLLWRDISDPKQVRWGIYNTGEGTDGTVVPAALSGDAGLVNILYDVPRADLPTANVAQLRHFNTAGHLPFTKWSSAGFADVFAMANHSFSPAYPIGNSYPNPFIVRTKVLDGDGGMGFQYDSSYLLNDALWDRFFFSSFPARGSFDFATDKLVNQRLRPFRPRADVPWNDPANFRSDSRSAAKNLLVDGGFNVNSTSVAAWKATLAGLRGVKVGGETSAANLTAPFARTLRQPGAAANSRDGNTENAWTGTINFTDAELDSLAREIVLQVHRRGPFLSLADFVNRRIIDAAATDQLGRGLAGALQAAIDRLFNQTSDVQPASLRTQSKKLPGNKRLADNAFVPPTGISGFSGYIYQADLLSAIGASLSARSDTFVIRAYGDAYNPVLARTEGQAWCEAVVQRLPDYVVGKAAGGNDPDETPASGSANESFGRRYQIVGFRWLSPNDI